MLPFNSTLIIWGAILNTKKFDFVTCSSFCLLAACIFMHLHPYLVFLEGVKMVTWVVLLKQLKENRLQLSCKEY